ncbi:MAG: tetratricopeptide repeat protein [Casimicrobiaceae bacterium]
MAVYDLEEQEQLDDLKIWWSRHGNKIAAAVIAVCVAYLGYQGWRWYSTGHTEAASTLYGAVSEGARTSDLAKSKEAMAQLADRYAGTPYAPRAALLYAKELWDSGDKAGARIQLQWVLDHTTDNELLEVTRYRLAETWLDEGKSDEALKLLDAKTDDAFAGIYADLRGDALAAAGRNDEARKAYEIALAKIDARSPYRNYIEVKFQSLGGIVADTLPSAPGAAPQPAAKSAALQPAEKSAAPQSSAQSAAPQPAAPPGAPARAAAVPAAPPKDPAKP